MIGHLYYYFVPLDKMSPEFIAYNNKQRKTTDLLFRHCQDSNINQAVHQDFEKTTIKISNAMETIHGGSNNGKGKNVILKIFSYLEPLKR
jgi:hypothetical protein